MTTTADPRPRAASPGSVREAIDAFLALRRIAFVGLSTDPKHFSRAVDARLVAEHVDVVPVHPTAKEIDGRVAWPRVQDVPAPVEGALVMTPAAQSASVVRDCVEAGVRLVWLHRAGGEGSASAEAVALAREHGLRVVPGECPLMFLGRPAFVHRVHAFVRKLTGTYPR